MSKKVYIVDIICLPECYQSDPINPILYDPIYPDGQMMYTL